MWKAHLYLHQGQTSFKVSMMEIRKIKFKISNSKSGKCDRLWITCGAWLVVGAEVGRTLVVVDRKRNDWVTKVLVEM